MHLHARTNNIYIYICFIGGGFVKRVHSSPNFGSVAVLAQVRVDPPPPLVPDTMTVGPQGPSSRSSYHAIVVDVGAEHRG